MFFKKIFLVGFFAMLFAAVGFAAPRTKSASAKSGDAASLGEVTFRCAFWERPAENFPVLYVRERGKYAMLSAFAMSFGRSYSHRGSAQIPVFRKATAAEIEQRKAAGVKKSELEYIPLFSINPNGNKDIGVVFLPGKWENKPANEILVFDWSERSFPYGTIRIANFSGRSLVGQMLMRGAETPEKFRMNHAGIWTSPPIEMAQRICEIQLAALVDKKPQVVYASAAAFFGDSRTMIFIIPDPAKKTLPNEAPKLKFCTIKDRKPIARPHGGNADAAASSRENVPPADAASSARRSSSSRRSRR